MTEYILAKDCGWLRRVEKEIGYDCWGERLCSPLKIEAGFVWQWHEATDAGTTPGCYVKLGTVEAIKEEYKNVIGAATE